MNQEKVKKAVREGYAEIAKRESSCCAPSCCGDRNSATEISKNVGYTPEELKNIPAGADLGLGCGNPVALASLKPGETVLDLGSGAGVDCFLAANKVGPKGKVIGIDMTPEMIDKARENARKGDYANVEFRLGEIENLPVADSSVDVVISNCVINLAPDKSKVFKETFRVLKPGGRMMISDLVLNRELPDFIKNSIEAYVGCLSGAIMKDDYLAKIKAAGFQEAKIMDETSFSIDNMLNDPTAQAVMEKTKITAKKAKEVARMVESVKVKAVKSHLKNSRIPQK
jgi:ubiquinone/menaquinone biosynthesis C-methylase UbiE